MYRINSQAEEEMIFTVGGLANGFLGLDSKYKIRIPESKNNVIYKIVVNNVIYSYTSGNNQTKEQIRDGLYNVFNADTNKLFTITKSSTDSIELTGKNNYIYLMLKGKLNVDVLNVSGVVVMWYQQDIWGALNQVKPNLPFFVLSINTVFTRTMSEKWQDVLEAWGKSKVCYGNIDIRCFSVDRNLEILQYISDNIKNGLAKNIIPYKQKIIWMDEYTPIEDVSEIEDIQRQLQSTTNLRFMFEVFENMDKEYEIIGWFDTVEFTGTNIENETTITKIVSTNN